MVEFETEIDFVEMVNALRQRGYCITPDSFVQAELLLLSLCERGVKLSLDHVASLLSPIFSKRPDQQSAFREHIRPWIHSGFSSTIEKAAESQKVLPGGVTTIGTKEETALLASGFRRGLIKWSGYVVANVVAIVVLYFGLVGSHSGDGSNILDRTLTRIQSTGPQSIEPRANGSDEYSSERESVSDQKQWICIAILVSGNLMMWWYLTSLNLVRVRGSQGSSLGRLRVPRNDSLLFGHPRFQSEMRRWAAHRRISTGRLDAARTVRKSIESGGLFTPVELVVPIRPLYIALVETTNANDHLYELFVRFLREFRRLDGNANIWFFTSSPSLCTSPDSATTTSLSELFASYPSSCLIVLGQPSIFSSATTGEVADWVNKSSSWEDRRAIVPSGITMEEMAKLKSVGFEVYVITKEGLRSETSDGSIVADDMQETSVSLRAPEIGWLNVIRPSPDKIAALILDLKYFLGRKGYDLLTAAAVFPRLRWEISLYLYTNLTGSLRSPDYLSRICSLPWFRYGAMPDWLRLVLIEDMPRHFEIEVRETLARVLFGNIRSQHHAEIVVHDRPLRPSEWWHLDKAFGRHLREIESDSLCISFLRGSRLGVSIPRKESKLTLEKVFLLFTLFSAVNLIGGIGAMSLSIDLLGMGFIANSLLIMLLFLLTLAVEEYRPVDVAAD